MWSEMRETLSRRGRNDSSCLHAPQLVQISLSTCSKWLLHSSSSHTASNKQNQNSVWQERRDREREGRWKSTINVRRTAIERQRLRMGMTNTEQPLRPCGHVTNTEQPLRPCGHVSTHHHSHQFATYSPFQKKKKLIPEVYMTFFKCFERYSSFLFSSVLSCFCPSSISISSVFYLGKATFPFSHENQWFCLFTHKQAFAAGVCCTCTDPTCSAQRPVADDFYATALVRGREDGSKKSEMCWYKRKLLNFLFCQSRRALLDALLLCLFGGERQDSVVTRPCLASSPLLIVKVDVSEISNRLPGNPTLKKNSHEAWICSVTRKKYFERPHTAVFRRQQLGTTPSAMTRRSFWRLTSSSSSLISTRTPY